MIEEATNIIRTTIRQKKKGLVQVACWRFCNWWRCGRPPAGRGRRLSAPPPHAGRCPRRSSIIALRGTQTDAHEPHPGRAAAHARHYVRTGRWLLVAAVHALQYCMPYPALHAANHTAHATYPAGSIARAASRTYARLALDRQITRARSIEAICPCVPVGPRSAGIHVRCFAIVYGRGCWLLGLLRVTQYFQGVHTTYNDVVLHTTPRASESIVAVLQRSEDLPHIGAMHALVHMSGRTREDKNPRRERLPDRDRRPRSTSIYLSMRQRTVYEYSVLY